MKWIACLCIASIWLSACLADDQKMSKKDKAEALTTRSVQGIVSDKDGNSVAGAIVQLKDTKTLQVRSFVTKPDGSYYFHGLSTNVDYDLKAQSGDTSASWRTLSSFDSRKTATLDFKLEPNKKTK